MILLLTLLSASLFNGNRCSIANHFRDPVANFRCVVAHADDRVGPEFARVGEHLIERVLAGPFAQFGVDRDIPAEDALDVRAQVADDRP